MSRHSSTRRWERALVVVSHTHWDREWYETFQAFRLRLVDLVDEVLDILASEPEYRCFTLDGQSVVLEDYLELRPERADDIRRLVTDGRLLIGPWYVLPDEFLVGAEALVRNLAIGRRVARGFGGVMEVGYLPDQFGHVGQMPQLLRGFGIDTAVLWRGVGAGLAGRHFWWQAPDGGRVLVAHLPGGYFNAVRLPHEPAELEARMEAIAAEHEGVPADQPILLMNGSDHVFPQRDLPAVLRRLREAVPDGEVTHGSLPEYAGRARARASNATLAVWTGELRDCRLAPVLPGVLSARVALKQRNALCEALLTHRAEPALAWAALLEGESDWSASRRAALRRAWQYLLHNHAHDSICGCSVDRVHEEMEGRFRWAEEVARGVARDSLSRLAAAIDTASPPGAVGEEAAILVHNPVGGPRVDLARARVRVPAGRGVLVRDAQGRPAPAQVVSRQAAGALARDTSGGVVESSLDVAGSEAAEEVEVAFLAREVPERGYRVYHLSTAGKENGHSTQRRGEWMGLENEYLRVTANEDGTLDLLDKATGGTWARLGLLVDGGDAGDEYNYSPPSRDRLVNGPAGSVRRRMVERGPARYSLELEGSLAIPARLRGDRTGREDALVICPFQTRASLLPGVRRLDLELTVWNHASDHRLRLHFPLGERVATARAEGHFELVERAVRLPEADQSWIERPAGTHPHRGTVIAGGLAVAAPGLAEYEIVDSADGSEVALTLLRCVGWLSRDDLSTRRGHAGPGLPTPGAQCHGRHTFRIGLIPFDGTPADALAESHRFAHPLGVASARPGAGNRPPEASLLEVSPATLVVSALKAPEEGQGLVARLWNPTASPVEARLTPGFPARVAVLCDLEEVPRRELPWRGGRVELMLRAAEIATVRFEAGA